MPAPSPVSASAPVAPQQPARPAADATSGEGLFAAQCGFCHGRDATGGQTGPDLTDSDLVAQDVGGDKIGPVVRNGRPEKGMPPFAGMADGDLKKIVDYIHARKSAVDANSRPEPAYMVRLASALQSGGKNDEAIVWCDKVAATPDVHPQIKSIATQVRAAAVKAGGKAPGGEAK